MDTNVSAIESGEDITINIEDPMSPHPETPENSDIALFKEQLFKSGTVFHSDIQTSELYTEPEQTENLVDLSHKFKNLLQKETQPLFHSKGNTIPTQTSAKPTTPLDKPNTHTTPIPTKDNLDKQVDLKDINMTKEVKNDSGSKDFTIKGNSVPTQTSAKSTTSLDKPNTHTTPIPTKDNLNKQVDLKDINMTKEVKNDSVSKDFTIKGNSVPTQTSAKPTAFLDKPNTHTTPIPTKDNLNKQVDLKDINMAKEVKNDSVSKDFTIKEETPLHIQGNPFVATSDTPLITNLTPSSTVTETTASHAAMISQQIKDQIIDRILVSTNDLAADKTVKVTLNPTILESTEINFQKIGNTLSVQFISRSENSLSFLQTNQTDLQGYLQNELKQFKGVSVSVKSSENNAGQPGDGRSRNRYDYQALDEDEQ